MDGDVKEVVEIKQPLGSDQPGDLVLVPRVAGSLSEFLSLNVSVLGIESVKGVLHF